MTTRSKLGGSLHNNIPEWQNITHPQSHIVQWLKDGVKIPFKATPPPSEEPNRYFNHEEFKFVKSEQLYYHLKLMVPFFTVEELLE